jgi:DNA (cytosine-5)-methyltransferase 1
MDFESETFVCGPLMANGKAAGSATQQDAEQGMLVVHTLRGEGFDASEDGTGRGTGRGTPLVPVAFQERGRKAGRSLEYQEDLAYSLTAPNGGGRRQELNVAVPIPSTFQNTGHGYWNDEPVAQTIRDASVGGASHSNLVAIPIQEPGSRTGKSTDDPRIGIGIGTETDPMFTLQSGHQHAVAFSSKDHGADATEDLAPTLRAMPHAGSHPNGGGQVAVAFESRFARNGRGAPSEIVPPLKAQSGQSGQSGKGDAAPLLATTMAVRRLTPRECERLQGFQNDYTLVPYHGKPAADGPRYKAIGNSMACPCMEWIGMRIEKVEGQCR